MCERAEFQNPQNWHNRGYLPHYDIGGKYQMITYRLADSLPVEVLHRLKSSLAGSADCQSAISDERQQTIKRKAIEEFLDKGFGSCILANKFCAEIVAENWKYFDSKRYELFAYVIMPNHVHLLVKTFEEYPIGGLVKTWKSFSAKAIRKLFREGGADYQSALPAILLNDNPFWQREYWDRFIRDEKHFNCAINYILENPVKAGLVNSWQDWPWNYCKIENIPN